MLNAPTSRNHDEMLSEREEIDPGDPSQERSGFSKAASIPKQFAKDEWVSYSAEQPCMNIGPLRHEAMFK